MPVYDYYSEETGEELEVIHGIDEEPEVLDSQGNKMKRIIKLGHGGYHMKKDSTRNKDWGTRYGGRKRKSTNVSTPEESGTAKAKESFSKSEHDYNSKLDPYYQHR